MDKQIEEIQKILEYCCNEYDEKGRHIRNKCNSWDCEYYDETNGVCASYSLKEARALYNAGYRKIPKNAVVLTSDEFWKLSNKFSKKELDEIVEFHKNKARKQTAEKFAERLKEVEEALLDMVVQFCQMGEEGYLKHIFMSAEEQAFDVLDIDYGEKVYDVYERFNKKWNRPIDEICKEITEGEKEISNETV